MKRFVCRFISCLFLSLLFMSCIDEDYSACPVSQPNRGVRVFVDWSMFNKEVPTGMTVMIYPQSGGAPSIALTNDISHADFSLPPGAYRVLVFNQSVNEFGTFDFQDMDSYEEAKVVVHAAASQWYSRADEELIAMEPEWLGVGRLDNLMVSEDSVAVTIQPRNVVKQVHVEASMDGIHNLRSVRGSLTGIASGYLLGQGKEMTNVATYLMEKWTKSVDGGEFSRGVLNTSFRCFGLPSLHDGKSDRNQLGVSTLLVDNKTQVDHSFEVGDQFELEKNDEEADMSIKLNVKVKTQKPLPDVKPAGDASAGGFDVDIKDWGKPEDIEMDI